MSEACANVDKLTVSRVFVDEAQRLRRFMPRAKGRANRIVKRNSHITVVVASR